MDMHLKCIEMQRRKAANGFSQISRYLDNWHYLAPGVMPICVWQLGFMALWPVNWLFIYQILYLVPIHVECRFRIRNSSLCPTEMLPSGLR